MNQQGNSIEETDFSKTGIRITGICAENHKSWLLHHTQKGTQNQSEKWYKPNYKSETDSQT